MADLIDGMTEDMCTFLRSCQDVMQVKNRDYHPEGIPMLEVFRAAAEADISPQQVLWGHFRKHVSSVHSYVIGRRSQAEPLDARLVDVINYMTLLQFLETNYLSLLEQARRYVMHNTTCSCILGHGVQCDSCLLRAWTTRRIDEILDRRGA